MPKDSAIAASETVARQATPMRVRPASMASPPIRTTAKHDNHDAAFLQPDAGNLDGVLQRRRQEGDARRAEDQPVDLLHRHEQADRGDQRDMGRLVEDRLVEQPVEGHAEEADRDDGDDEGGGEAAGFVGQQQADIGAQREDAGMGDMQDAQQPVDQRQADGDQGIDAAFDQPLDQKIGIAQRGKPRLLLGSGLS